MAGFANDVVFANNADFSIAGSNKGSAANGLNTNGQMWIGTTTPNAGGTRISVGTITSPNSTITIGYSAPNITLSSAAFRQVVQQTFLTSGTYTPTAGMKYCIVEAVGGGGGSGGAAPTGAGQVSSGGGGGAGLYSRIPLTAAQIGVSKSITIGAAGIAGSSAGGDGGPGGASDITGLINAGGGSGGGGGGAGAISNAAGGAGGQAGGPGIIAHGQSGTGSIASFSAGFNIPGNGGSCYFGGGTPATIVGVGAGVFPGTSPSSLSRGCGASGGACGESSAGAIGAIGAIGFVLITEFI